MCLAEVPVQIRSLLGHVIRWIERLKNRFVAAHQPQNLGFRPKGKSFHAFDGLAEVRTPQKIQGIPRSLLVADGQRSHGQCTLKAPHCAAPLRRIQS